MGSGKQAAILGAGPSGMMAAYAAAQCGYDPVIFDQDPDKTRRNSGVFYLHSDCDLALEPIEIRQRVIGAVGMSQDEVAYAYGMKVYGRKVAKTSVIDVLKTPTVVGYDATKALDLLWDMFGKNVKLGKIKVGDIKTLPHLYNRVISTLPATIWAEDRKEEFEFEKLWMKVLPAPEGESFTYYNVNPFMNWYRASAIFGRFIYEYAHGEAPFDTTPSNVYEVTKVIKGPVLRPPYPNVLYIGRYGAWDKTQLTHSVYEKTVEWLLG
jgi:hypothetical protein